MVFLWFRFGKHAYRCKGFHRIDVKLLHMANLVNEVYAEQMVRDCEENMMTSTSVHSTGNSDSL